MTLPSSVSQLSWREKIGQTCQIHGGDLNNIAAETLAEHFRLYPAGSIFFGGEVIGPATDHATRLRERIAGCQQASRIPLSISGDLENGAGGAVRGLTAFPNLLALGATDDAELAYEYGKWTALEAVQAGFNWTFGPVADLSLNWLNPIVSIRSLGSNPERVGPLAAAIIRGFQDHGLSATAKHFPGDGVDFRDQHLCVSINSLSEEEWRQTFGPVFENCIQAGVHAIMAGHVALPWFDPTTIAGGAPLPATTSHRILDGLLREQMGFEGVLVSDALIMAGFRGRGQRREDLIVEAFNAGIDVMLWPGPDYFELMERALHDGRISEARLDQSVERILAMKRLQQPASPAAQTSHRQLEGALHLANNLAERSLTLVRNDRGLLPLDPAKTKRVQILLATPHEEGATERLAPLIEGLRSHGVEVDLHVNGNCLDLRKREAAGERFDVLLAVFELWTHALKNTMRPTGSMAECLWTIQGLETVEPIVVSLGSPYLLYDMPWAETCINAYSSNAHTQKALASALFGQIPFAGASPVEASARWITTDGRLPLGALETA